MFLDNFPLIRRMKGRAYKPEVVYPSIDEKAFIKNKEFKETIETLIGRQVNPEKTIIMTSLNRYERKKNIPLALEAFAHYMKQDSRNQFLDPILVIAGGYDERLDENVSVYQELETRAAQLGLSDRVILLRSISNDRRILLLEHTKILLYTPENEHFGIVPVEAMYMGCIAFACNSGGPLESVEHGVTGYLMEPKSEVWGRKIYKVLAGTVG